jgi:transposase
LLAEMPKLGEFDSARSAAAHTGLTPKRRQSGTSINAPTRISKIGNPRVRYALYLPAMTALRSSKEFKELAARLTERGKKKMQIIAAAMHKLVRIAYGVLKNQRPYDPSYVAVA